MIKELKKKKIRLRISLQTYNELIEARDWCTKNGLNGLKQWYDEELAFQTKRRALPLDIQPDEEEFDHGRFER